VEFSLRIWRQQNSDATGSLQRYSVDQVTPDMSFLEMLDHLNERLIKQGELL